MKWISSVKGCEWTDGNNLTNEQGDELILTEATEQSIDGFGGCFNELGMKALNTLSDADRSKVFDELFAQDKCAFNFCRLPVGANDFAESWYSYNETEGDYKMEHFSVKRDEKYIIPYVKEAQKRNNSMKFFASPWSPPTWMKFPRAYNYGTLVQTDENLKAYALYFKKYILEYKKYGIDINQIHVQNEPVSTQKFPSCIWTGEEFTRFIADYLIDEIGDLAEIWIGTINAPESNERTLTTRYNQYVNLVMQNEKCKKHIKGASYQWAGKFAVQQTHDDYPHLKLMQSESECGDSSNSWEYAMYIFELIRHYLRNGVSSYIYWNMVLQEGGESTWGWRQNSLVTVADGKVIFNPEFYVMKHFSHFVKPGAVLINTKGAWSSNASAFLNPDGTKIVAVMNPFEFEKVLTISGVNFKLKPKSFNTIVL